jgi:hypothetical protein
MKAMEVRLDHARVVLMFRKEGALPLIKDYLLNVQKTNILEVRRDVFVVQHMCICIAHLLNVQKTNILEVRDASRAIDLCGRRGTDLPVVY